MSLIERARECASAFLTAIFGPPFADRGLDGQEDASWDEDEENASGWWDDDTDDGDDEDFEDEDGFEDDDDLEEDVDEDEEGWEPGDPEI